MRHQVRAFKAGRTAHLSLDRPEALHALTLDMCLEMTEALLAWRADPEVELVILDHAEGRGFCAGDDVRIGENDTVSANDESRADAGGCLIAALLSEEEVVAGDALDGLGLHRDDGR